MSDPSPDWYDDPDRLGQQRYWDGTAWTDHRRQSQPAPPPAFAGGGQETAAGATTSLVLGILSLVLCGLFTGIPAMIVGRRATREIDASNGRLAGHGLAQAGFVTGLIGTILTSLGLLLVVVTLAFGAVVSTTYEESCVTVDNTALVECS